MLQRWQSLGTLRTPIGSLVKVRDPNELGALQATMNQALLDAQETVHDLQG